MSALSTAIDWTADHQMPVLLAAAIVCSGGAALMARQWWKQLPTLGAPGAERRRRRLSAGTAAAAFAFVVCTSVSLNTSYRFTLDGLDMHGTAERVLSCAAFEALIAMCVLGARERMSSEDEDGNPLGSPGWYGSAVWIFAALSSIPAWHEGGGMTTGTVVRIIVGSFGSALAAHSALGLELKHRTGDASQTALAQISRDLRERLMARLGLAHRGRTAQEISQRRALDRAVTLYARHHAHKPDGWRARRLAGRLATAQDRAGVHTDEAIRAEYRARCAGRVYAAQLHLDAAESPWHTGAPAEETVTHAEQLATQATAHVAEQVREVLAQHGGAVPGPRVELDAGADEDEPDCLDEDDYEPGRAAAAHGRVPVRVEARVPESDPGQDEDERQDDAPALAPSLADYRSKRQATEALYRAKFLAADDGTQTTNAVAEKVAAAFVHHFGAAYDRANVHKAIDPLRPEAQEQATQRELTSV